jgi:excisionase family DNA binding protein
VLHTSVVPARNAPNPLPSRPLTIRELAFRWQCSSETLLRAVRRGDLTAFRAGLRKYRITPQEIARVEQLRGAA